MDTTDTPESLHVLCLQLEAKTTLRCVRFFIAHSLNFLHLVKSPRRLWLIWHVVWNCNPSAAPIRKGFTGTAPVNIKKLTKRKLLLTVMKLVFNLLLILEKFCLTQVNLELFQFCPHLRLTSVSVHLFKCLPALPWTFLFCLFLNKVIDIQMPEDNISKPFCNFMKFHKANKSRILSLSPGKQPTFLFPSHNYVFQIIALLFCSSCLCFLCIIWELNTHFTFKAVSEFSIQI